MLGSETQERADNDIIDKRTIFRLNVEMKRKYLNAANSSI